MKILAALLALLPTLSRADVAVPHTPVGGALSAWLEAFNDGDRANKESFSKAFGWNSNLDGVMSWREEVGGYDLLGIYASDKDRIFFQLKPRAGGVDELGILRLSSIRPPVIGDLGSWRIPSGARVEILKLDQKARARLIEQTADAYDTAYIDPDLGKKMADALRRNEKRGDYRGFIYWLDFARKLTQDVQAISHDRHAEIRYSSFVKPAQPPEKQAALDARRLTAINCGFEKAEHLRPNIGYLKFNMFGDPAVCAPTASAAMGFLANSDALIIDLRDNHGGHAGMPEIIASYLFAERTHLGDLYSRKDDRTTETWTTPDLPGKKFVGKPVYILTSSQTFSAAEALTYDLKNLKRVTVVGEKTQGGAHPTEDRPLDAHFTVRVPFAKSINPVTKTNYEGVGVEPDVAVPADQALETALKLAAGAIGN